MSPPSSPKQHQLWILRGSLIVHRRKCGHTSCRCHCGRLHESFALSIKIDGTTHLITLFDHEVPLVQAAIDRYQKAYSTLEERVKTTLGALQTHHHEARSRSKRTTSKAPTALVKR